MKMISSFACLAMLGASFPVQSAEESDGSERWNLRMDLGGTIPQDARLTEFGGPVSGRVLKLEPGFQFDLAVGYRPKPWLDVGPEIGFTFNGVDSVAGWSYPNSMLWQILMMADVRIEYPREARLAPFIGAGVGGVASLLSFGGHGYNGNSYFNYYSGPSEPDASGSDFSLGFQVFGGLRYRVADKFNLGLEYRYLQTDRQHWDVKWWDEREFGLTADSIRMHSICLVFSGEF